MIEIELTQAQVALVDDEDADLTALKWFAHFHPGYAGGGAFRVARHTLRGLGRRRTILMHRVILSRMLGRELARGEQADHINCDPLDNRRGNLRLATHAENSRNRRLRADNASGYKGAYWHKQRQRWQAQVRVDRKLKHLGYFDTAEEAARAYDAAARELHGEFARLNFPDAAQSGGL